MTQLISPARTARSADRPRVLVLLPMVWSVRNVVHSGLLDRLADDGLEMMLVLLRAPENLGPEFDSASRVDGFLTPGRRGTQRGRAWLESVLKAAFNQRNRISSYPIYTRWFERDLSRRERIRAASIRLVGRLASWRPVYDALRGRRESMYRLSHDLEPIRAQIRSFDPDLIWSTVSVAAPEYPYCLAARDLGIPIVSCVLSFDNLTSRWAPFRHDHYLVWCESMRDRLLELYPDVRPDQVDVTGTPQFDFHRRPEFVWPRERTLDRLGLPAGSRYILYACSHWSLAPAEPELVAALARRLEADPALKDHRLVVRLHPLDHWDRYRTVLGASTRVIGSDAWDTKPDADGWTLATRDDQARLVSTIHHADVCLNIASTMTLDAAILDRPVIGLDFRSDPEFGPRILFEEYEVEHYAPLVASGGLRLASDWNDLRAKLREAIDNPARDAEPRAAMVRRECGIVDGNAAQRVADRIIALARESQAHRVGNGTNERGHS